MSTPPPPHENATPPSQPWQPPPSRQPPFAQPTGTAAQPPWPPAPGMPPPGAWQQPGWRPPPPPPVAPNGQPLAGFGDRLLAILIDYAVFIGVSMIWSIPLTVWYLITFFNLVERQSLTPGVQPDFGEFLQLYIPLLVLMGVSVVLGSLYTYLYFVEYQLRQGGQTVGKRVMKLRVVPVEPGARLTRVDLVKRWAVQWIAGSWVPFFSYLDGLWQLWDKPLQQCLHDKAAKTVVTKVG